MDIEKNNDIQVEKSSPEREEDAQQTEYVRITEKLTDIKVINRFNFQLRNSKTNEEKLSDLKVLSETPSPILYKFYTTPGLRTLGEWIYEGCDNIQQNAQVLEKIFTLLKEIQLKNEHLENAHYLGLGIEKMHIAQQNSEDNEAFNIFYKFYNLNKQIVNDWLENFKKRSQDPNFKRQQLWSEQQKIPGKRTFNTANNNNNNKYPQKDFQQNKFNQNNNFQKGNNNKYGGQQRGDSPPTQKKMKYNNGNAGTTGFNNNSNINFKPGTKSVRFTNDEQIKRFRKEDEPIAPDMTDTEVEVYQQECIKKKQANNHIFTTQDMRERENKLEKESRNQQKESEKKERQMLDEMKPDIQWKTPMKIKGLNSQFFENLSSESLEKKLHDKRILCKMQSLYGSDNEIPQMPSYDNVINDKLSTQEPKQIFLNKLDENDFIQVIEMAIKNENNEQKKKTEKKVLKSILKVSKEEKELQRKKMIQEKKKQAEDEERIKAQINQHTFNQLIDLIMNNKNSSKEELISAVKNLGLSEKELHNIYQNINIIKKLWQQRQATQNIPTGKFGIHGEERKEQILPPPPSNQQQLNNFGSRQGSNPGALPFPNNNQQVNMNNAPSQFGQQNQQNNSYNQYRSQQVNPQQNYQNNNQFNNSNNFQNNNQVKPPMNNIQFNNQPPQQNFNNTSNQRFGSNSAPQSNNQNNYPPHNQQGSQQNYEYNNQNQNPSQNYDQPQQQPYQNYQNQGQNQYNPQQQNYYQNQNNNNFNNNRGAPHAQRPNNVSLPNQANNIPVNNQFNQQQRQGNFGSNQGQQQQQLPHQSFQQKQFFNNNHPNQSQQGMQNKPFPQQNQQNKPNGYNPNNQATPLQPTSQLPQGQQQNEESSTKHVPCRMYHSEMGCKRDICNFLHIPEFQGRAAPQMHKLVRPMHALSKNGERNLENTFAYNRAKFEKKTGQLNALPFPMSGGAVPPPPPSMMQQQQQQQQQSNPFVGYQQQQLHKQQPQQQQSNMTLFSQTNPLLKQQFKPQPPQKI